MPIDNEDFDGDETIETTFRRLRRNGHSRQEAVRAILDELDVSLAEAKELLLTSDTWAEAARHKEPESFRSTPALPDSPPPAPG